MEKPSIFFGGLGVILALSGCDQATSSNENEVLAILDNGAGLGSNITDGSAIYNSDGTISTSANLTASGEIPNEFQGCYYTPNQIFFDLPQDEQDCKNAKGHFANVVPLTDEKDFEVAKMEGFLWKTADDQSAFYQFRFDCPGNSYANQFNIWGIQADMSTANIEVSAAKMADCTFGDDFQPIRF